MNQGGHGNLIALVTQSAELIRSGPEDWFLHYDLF